MTTRVPATAGPRAELGRRVAHARRAAGLTQMQLGESLGLSLREVERLENGEPNGFVDLGLIALATRSADLLLDEPPPSDADGACASTVPVTHADDEKLEIGHKLVLGVLAALVLVRFFTEVVHVLPRAANFLDVPLLVILVFVASLTPRGPQHRGSGLFFAPVLLFLGLCAISAIANPSRVESGPGLLFIFGFLEPVVFFYAASRLWTAGRTLWPSRLIVWLGLIQFAVVFAIDLPRFVRNGNPDSISGTFGENPYQLVFFLITFAVLVAGIATFERHRAAARFAPLLVGGALVVIFLAQYRSLLVTTAIAMIVTGVILGAVRGRGLVVLSIMLGSFIFGLSYVSIKYPLTRLTPAVQAITQNPGALASAKLQIFRDVLHLYGDDPRYVLTGTGPGTYSSRAWETFSLVGLNSQANVAGAYVSRLTGGHAYHTDVSDRYVLPRYENGVRILGSKAASSPLSSYSSLLAEVGLGGFALMFFIYLRALGGSARLTLRSVREAPEGDPLPALLLAVTLAFFVLLQMAILDNWLEAARVTVPAWILLGIGMKEAAARAGRYR